jgi:hypothetical protein
MINTLPRSVLDMQHHIVDYIQSKQNKDLNIVYIGANDGIYINPLYDIMRWKADDINILISEPQQELAVILNHHLHFLKKKIITTTLINDGKDKTFYSIKPEYYNHYRYPFLKNHLPVYVSPTAISGCNKTLFLKKYYDKAFNPKQLPWEKHVNITQKSSQNLSSWLTDNNFVKPIDILFTMAQGEDATILYNNDWDAIQPHIIVCDNSNWEQKEISELFAFLEAKQYECRTMYLYARFMVANKKFNKNEE